MNESAMTIIKRILCTVFTAMSICLPLDKHIRIRNTVNAVDSSEAPSDYQTACDWIWSNRIEPEKTVTDRSTVFDQIIAGNGTLHYILLWQSDAPITLRQRQKLPEMLENAVNQWTDNLIGYDDWPYEHITVKVVGFAVLDESCLLDLQPDEIVYTDTTHSWLRDGIVGSMGDKTIPVLQPAEPTDYSRYVHWNDSDWSYGGSYDNRYDMYLHGIKGMTDAGGYGYHYGQILSDKSVFGLIDGTTSQHILLHEIGHGFGFPDYYGGEGESDGYPLGGFPGGEGSVMKAGSCTYINDFDKYFLRYLWSKLKSECGRFKLDRDANRISGDVNLDGIVNIADVILLQKWLLAVPDTYLADWKAADLYDDNKLDVFDLCLMKRMLLNQYLIPQNSNQPMNEKH